MIILTGPTLFNTLTYIGLTATTVINSLLVISTTPMLIILLNKLIYKNQTNLFQMLGVILSLIGVSYVITKGNYQNIFDSKFYSGDLFILLAVISWALYSIFLKKNETGVSGFSFLYLSFVFVILIGASMFSLVFRGFGGDEMIEHFLGTLPGGLYAALILVMIVIFLLGFFLDYIEIIFVIVPLVGPILIANGADPLWLGILISLNLQTSFLTPPFGFSLFFLRGVAPSSIKTRNMYRGVIPFIGIQVLAILIVGFYPEIATWLPNKMF